MKLPKENRTPWFAAFVLAILMYAINHDFALPTVEVHGMILTADTIAEGSQLRRGAFIALGVFGLCLMATYRHRSRVQGFVGGSLLCYLLWCAVSVGWSEEAFTTLKRVGAVACICLAAAGVARHFSGTALLKLVVVAGAMLILVGFASAFWHGTFQPWEPGYRLTGTLHPNAAGLLAALFSVAAMTLTIAEPKRRLGYWILFGVGLGVVLLSGSRSSLAGVLFAFFLFSLLTWSRERKAFMVLGGVMGACALLFAYGDLLIGTVWDGLLLGRSSEEAVTLTGRLPLWDQLLEISAENLWTGVGFFSFWTTESIAKVSRGQEWPIESGHSVYMEVLLDLGVVGVILYCAAIFSATVLAMRRFRKKRRPIDLFWGLLLGMVILAGALESIVPGYPGYLLQFIAFTALWRLAFVDDQTVVIAARRVRSGFRERPASSKTAGPPAPPLPAARG